MQAGRSAPSTVMMTRTTVLIAPFDSSAERISPLAITVLSTGTTAGNGNKTFQMSKAWGPYFKSIGGEDVDTVDNRVFNLRIEGDFDLGDRTFDYQVGVTDGTSFVKAKCPITAKGPVAIKISQTS